MIKHIKNAHCKSLSASISNLFCKDLLKHRYVSHSSQNNSSKSSGQFQSEEERIASLQPLLKNKWECEIERDAIKKQFVFKDFKQAFAFMTAVALASEQKNHHPEWTNVYNNVTISWTTHSTKNLTKKDILLAVFCDELHRKLSK